MHLPAYLSRPLSVYLSCPIYFYLTPLIRRRLLGHSFLLCCGEKKRRETDLKVFSSRMPGVLPYKDRKLFLSFLCRSLDRKRKSDGAQKTGDRSLHPPPPLLFILFRCVSYCFPLIFCRTCLTSSADSGRLRTTRKRRRRERERKERKDAEGGREQVLPDQKRLVIEENDLFVFTDPGLKVDRQTEGCAVYVHLFLRLLMFVRNPLNIPGKHKRRNRKKVRKERDFACCLGDDKRRNLEKKVSLFFFFLPCCLTKKIKGRERRRKTEREDRLAIPHPYRYRSFLLLSHGLLVTLLLSPSGPLPPPE